MLSGIISGTHGLLRQEAVDITTDSCFSRTQN